MFDIKRRRLISVLTVIFVFIGLLLVKVAKWVPDTFGDIPFEQVIFHLLVPLVGTDTSFVDSFIQECLPLPSIVSGLFLILCILKDWQVGKDIKNGEFKHRTYKPTIPFSFASRHTLELKCAMSFAFIFYLLFVTMFLKLEVHYRAR